jgi:hypothetical protein
MPRRLNARMRSNSYIAVTTFLAASARRESGYWTGKEIDDRCTDGRDWYRISAVANAPTGFVRKRRTPVLIRRTVFVVLSRIYCEIRTERRAVHAEREIRRFALRLAEEGNWASSASKLHHWSPVVLTR